MGHAKKLGSDEAVANGNGRKASTSNIFTKLLSFQRIHSFFTFIRLLLHLLDLPADLAQHQSEAGVSVSISVSVVETPHR